jgi:lipoprotein NlpD
VRKGDTLYGIALDHGLDYRELASWNEIADPNVIRVDQTLRLRPPPGWQPPPEPANAPAVVSQPLPPPPEIEAKPLAPLVVKTAPKAVKLAYSEAALAQLRGEGPKQPAAAAAPAARPEVKPVVAAPKPAPLPTKPLPVPPATSAAGKPLPTVVEPFTDTSWIWPAKGPLLHSFNQGANPKGVAIGGEPGQPVLASAAGKVVYSGSGLRGYGKLIIIKHNETYLSVYAHNRTLLVKEGERVARGQKIAEMGDSDAQRVALHFEIRRLGKPVDPMQYLPAAGA